MRHLVFLEAFAIGATQLSGADSPTEGTAEIRMPVITTLKQNPGTVHPLQIAYVPWSRFLKEVHSELGKVVSLLSCA